MRGTTLMSFVDAFEYLNEDCQRLCRKLIIGDYDEEEVDPADVQVIKNHVGGYNKDIDGAVKFFEEHYA